MADDKTSKKLERIYTIPLRDAFDRHSRKKRVPWAVKIVRAFLARHFKVEEAAVRVSEGVNSLLWRDSIEKPPRRIKLRGVKDGEAVKAWLIGEEEAVAKTQEAAKKKAEEKGKKEEKKADGKPAEKKEGAAPAEAKKAEAPAAKPATAPKAGDLKSGPSSAGAMPASRKQI